MKLIVNNDINQLTVLDERFYQSPQTEKWYPSVNEVLSVYPKGWGFEQWLRDVGNNSFEILKRKGEQGTKIHDAAEKLAKGEEVSLFDGEKENYTFEEWKMIMRIYEFETRYKPENIAVEISLVDDELGYGGTIDRVCKINGKIWLIDYKSGNSLHKSNFIQLAAYKKLWDKQAKDKVEKVGLLHLDAATRSEDKTGKKMQGEGWKVEEVEDIEKLNSLFKHAHEIWKEENPEPMPKNLIYPTVLKI